ncbi:MAG: hypothetical protein HYV97_02605 [Bdellovibrio sp.]|nr:hypothetical protein [Bdellovibrio sp.]
MNLKLTLVVLLSLFLVSCASPPHKSPLPSEEFSAKINQFVVCKTTLDEINKTLAATGQYRGNVEASKIYHWFNGWGVWSLDAAFDTKGRLQSYFLNPSGNIQWNLRDCK